MSGRVRRSTPRDSVGRECHRRGLTAFVDGCCRMLDGDDSDPGLIVVLGGPAGQELIEAGIPDGQRYWLRVWAARGLLWAWDDGASPALLEAATDVHWRVREFVPKIAARHGLSQTLPAIRRLCEDDVERVRSAARRAVSRLDGRPTP